LSVSNRLKASVSELRTLKHDYENLDMELKTHARSCNVDGLTTVNQAIELNTKQTAQHQEQHDVMCVRVCLFVYACVFVCVCGV